MWKHPIILLENITDPAIGLNRKDIPACSKQVQRPPQSWWTGRQKQFGAFDFSFRYSTYCTIFSLVHLSRVRTRELVIFYPFDIILPELGLIYGRNKTELGLI